MKQFYYLVAAMRPSQWTKNFVVFAGLVFSRNLQDTPLVILSVEAFALFCLFSGVIYVVNDIADVDRDRLHERKRLRALPSGKLTVPFAATGAALLAVAGLFLSSRIGAGFLAVSCAFLALNFLYSFLLKKLALVDVLSISLSFILRAIAGVEALRELEPAIAISPWLLICTLFLSLFLAFCKRRHELTTMASAENHRESLLEYSPALLDQLVSITAGGSILSYSIYTIWPETVEKFGTADLVYTVPVVLLGVMRYLYLVYNKQKGGSPSDMLLHERFLLGVVALWVVLVVVILGDF